MLKQNALPQRLLVAVIMAGTISLINKEIGLGLGANLAIALIALIIQVTTATPGTRFTPLGSIIAGLIVIWGLVFWYGWTAIIYGIFFGTAMYYVRPYALISYLGRLRRGH